MSVLEKTDKILDKFEELIVGYALILIVIIMFTNVVLRYVFKTSLPWGDELSRYLNIIAVYIGVGAGIKHGSHVGVTAFVELVLPKSWRKTVDVIAQGIVIVFCVAMAYYGCILTAAQFEMHQVSPALRMPIGIIYASIPVSMVLSILRTVRNICLTIKAETNVPIS